MLEHAGVALDARPDVVLLAPGQAPGDWQEARERWPDAWLVQAPLRPAAATWSTGALDAVLGQAWVPAVALDAGGALAWCNPAADRLHGGPLHDASALVAPAGTAAPLPDLGNRLRCADGGALPIEVQVLALAEHGLVLALRDASEQVRVREELARTARYHQALVENGRDAIAVLDAQGRIRYHNPAARPLLGVDPEELRGHPLPLAFAEDRLRFRRALEAALAAPGATASVTLRLRHSDGGSRWVEGLLANHLDNPQVAGLVLNSADITERRALEAGLRDAERVRTAGLLGATVAHDMNNMVSVVLAGLDQVQAAVGHDPDLAERLVSMRQALGRSSELARRLTSYGRKGVGGVRRVDLGAAVGDLRSLLEPVLRRGQLLTIEIAAGEHPVRVDVAELEQAIMNLVVNARDALGPAGRVQIAVERRPGGSRPEVALVIIDDGAGMDAETRARIFEPFFTTKGPERGTGLGMVVVKRFVAEAGGEISVESAPGLGTRVELLLPVDVGEPPPGPPSA